MRRTKVTEPTTGDERAKLKGRFWRTEDYAGPQIDRLRADVERLEGEARQNAEWCKAENAWAMELMDAVIEFDEDSDAGCSVKREFLEAVVVMLSPMVPHLCHALWQELGHESALIDQRWPEVDKNALQQDLVEMVVQVNGKLRARISVAVDAAQNAIEAQALADENVQRFIDKKEVRKVIVVPGRLVNIVV